MATKQELEAKRGHNSILADAWAERERWLATWRELNEGFYPFLYRSLTGTNVEQKQSVQRNTKMIDGTPAHALYTLAAGFMNGVTSPARKWLKVKRPGDVPYNEGDESESPELNAIQTKLLEVMAVSWSLRAWRRDASGHGRYVMR